MWAPARSSRPSGARSNVWRLNAEKVVNPPYRRPEKAGLFDDEHGAGRQAHEPVRSAADDPLIEL